MMISSHGIMVLDEGEYKNKLGRDTPPPGDTGDIPYVEGGMGGGIGT